MTNPFANAGDAFRKICGWSGGDGKISQINLTKFTQHLRAVLDGVKAANLSIDAFEIGNEFDTTCEVRSQALIPGPTQRVASSIGLACRTMESGVSKSDLVSRTTSNRVEALAQIPSRGRLG
jgi:hypothetical protein